VKTASSLRPPIQLMEYISRKAKDIPVYSGRPCLRSLDGDGSRCLFLLRLLQARDNKTRCAGGPLRKISQRLSGTLPVVLQRRETLRSPPQESRSSSALLSHDEFRFRSCTARSMFGTHDPSTVGAQSRRDFVEFPSQFNEHWSYPLLHAYASLQKGAPCPTSW